LFAVCEAMMVGLPVVGWRPQRWSRWLKSRFLYVDTDVGLVEVMRQLLNNPGKARALVKVRAYVRDHGSTLNDSRAIGIRHLKYFKRS